MVPDFPDFGKIFIWMASIITLLLVILGIKNFYTPLPTMEKIKTETGETYECPIGFDFNVKKLTCENIIPAIKIDVKKAKNVGN